MQKNMQKKLSLPKITVHIFFIFHVTLDRLTQARLFPQPMSSLFHWTTIWSLMWSCCHAVSQGHPSFHFNDALLQCLEVCLDDSQILCQAITGKSRLGILDSPGLIRKTADEVFHFFEVVMV